MQPQTWALLASLGPELPYGQILPRGVHMGGIHVTWFWNTGEAWCGPELPVTESLAGVARNRHYRARTGSSERGLAATREAGDSGGAIGAAESGRDCSASETRTACLTSLPGPSSSSSRGGAVWTPRDRSMLLLAKGVKEN